MVCDDGSARPLLLLLHDLILDAHILPAPGAPDDIDARLEVVHRDDIILPTPALEYEALRVIRARLRRERLQGDVLAYSRPRRWWWCRCRVG